MNLSCLLHGHNYNKVRTQWIPNSQDQYIATNYGGMIKYYECDVYLCERCLKEKLVATGQYEIRRY